MAAMLARRVILFAVTPSTQEVTYSNYPKGDDGAIEPLPPTATELVNIVPESEFSGYVGLQRGN